MYVDGFVVPVKTSGKAAYLRVARAAAAVFMEYGALRCVETWGDDVPVGEITSFPRAVKLEPDETAVFSWIEWPDRATRDAGNARVMADSRMLEMFEEGIIAGPRMIYGGFEIIVDERDAP